MNVLDGLNQVPGSSWVFHDPVWLLLLLALPLVAALRGRRSQEVFVLPFVAQWVRGHALGRSRAPIVLLHLGLAMLIIAMARPQRVEERKFVQREGYDVMLAIDLSGSMLAEDNERNGRRINRLQTIEPVIQAFMEKRGGDRIGVVAFGGRAYTLAPLSFDHDWLRQQVARLRVGLVEDGTALGDALALAVSRLGQPEREEAGKRKGGFIILLTDGANNAGAIDPLKAAQIAKAKGIPVYTIGAGREGIVPMPVFDRQGKLMGYQRVISDLDEATLKTIASETGGVYFRAADPDTVNAAFAEIDRTHKIEFEAKSSLRAQELFERMAWPGVLCCALALVLARPGRQEAAS